MPIYSDFNEQASGSSQPSMFFRRNKPLHSYLGGRKGIISSPPFYLCEIILTKLHVMVGTND